MQDMFGDMSPFQKQASLVLQKFILPVDVGSNTQVTLAFIGHLFISRTQPDFTR